MFLTSKIVTKEKVGAFREGWGFSFEYKIQILFHSYIYLQ